MRGAFYHKLNSTSATPNQLGAYQISSNQRQTTECEYCHKPGHKLLQCFKLKNDQKSFENDPNDNRGRGRGRGRSRGRGGGRGRGCYNSESTKAQRPAGSVCAHAGDGRPYLAQGSSMQYNRRKQTQCACEALSTKEKEYLQTGSHIPYMLA